MTEVRYNLRSHARVVSLPESTPRKYTPGDFPLSPVETVAHSGRRQDTATMTTPQLLYSKVARARSLRAQHVFREKPSVDSSTLVSVKTPISNVQKNSPEVKNEPSGVPITPMSEIPDGTETSSGRTTDCEDNGQWTEVRRGKRQNKPKESLTLAAPTRAENKLSPGQAKVVQEAEQRLTTPQRETIEKCARAVGVPHSFKFG